MIITGKPSAVIQNSFDRDEAILKILPINYPYAYARTSEFIQN